VALYIFMTFYATCLVVNWAFYARPRSILNNLEKKVA
jgi:NNP family nitrate/nitrite transporter-like MFS transporter